MLGKHKSFKIKSCISLLYFICYGCIGFNFLFFKDEIRGFKEIHAGQNFRYLSANHSYFTASHNRGHMQKGTYFLTISGCDLHKINCPNEVHVQKQSLTYVFSFKWKLFNLQVTVCQSFFFSSD